jgi:hypothetical protein
LTGVETARRMVWPQVRTRTLVISALESAGFVLFFLMLLAPGVYQPIKGVLLAFVSMALVLRILVERRVALHPHLIIGCLLFSSIGLAFVLRGYLANAPALRVASIYIVWPWVYLLLLTGLADEARLWWVGRLLAWMTMVISGYCASYILWSLGWLPDALYIPLDLGQRIGFYKGSMEVTLRPFTSLMFLVPFVTAALLAWPATAPVARRWLWLALALGGAIGFISGRRGLQLVLVLGIPIGLAFRMFLPATVRAAQRREFVRVVGGLAVLGTVAVVGFYFAEGLKLDVMWSTFKSGFQFTTDPVARARALQFDALLQGWSASPLLGAGHGTSAPGVIRSEEMPWAYELTYIALLYHTGIVGFIFYALGVGWIYVHCLRLIREGSWISPLTVAVLTGTTTALIANGTNPYLERYDSLWILFLPLGLVNVALLRRVGLREV